MSTDVGIWIDHVRAFIITLTSRGEPDLKIVESNVAGKRQSTGRVPYNAQLHRASGSHNKDERWREQELRRYFDDVIRLVRRADNIMIFGPNGGRRELLQRMHETNGIGEKVTSIEPCDHLTENQRLAFVRDYFEALHKAQERALV